MPDGKSQISINKCRITYINQISLLELMLYENKFKMEHKIVLTVYSLTIITGTFVTLRLERMYWTIFARD